MTFSTIMVANRGEVARRVIRAAKAVGLRCVAVYVDADADAPYVGEADVAMRLATNYLNGEAIIAAAKASSVDAIHPGYGFLSENGAFAAKVEAAGLLWIGPSPRVIDAMGDNLAAKKFAQRARRRGGKRIVVLGTTGYFSSATSRRRATSRSRSWATATAISYISASATVRFSVVTRSRSEERRVGKECRSRWS